MRNTLIQIGLTVLLLVFAGLTLQQCSEKRKAKKETAKAVQSQQQIFTDYINLVKAKTRIDTVYKEGATKTVTKTDFKRVTDTLFIESGKVYGVFRDSIIDADLTLKTQVIASDMKSISYDYKVREKIIREQSILTVHDTLIQQVRKGQLIGLADIGLHSYSAGLQYQSRKRIGFTARYNLYKSDGFVTVGVAYRIF